MAKKQAAAKHIERLTNSLAASFAGGAGDTEHGYELSSSFSLAEKRKLSGMWAVVEHEVDGLPYEQHFIATILKGAQLLEPQYLASYQFMEGVCVRKSSITGTLLLPDGHAQYDFRLSVALQWVLEPQSLLVRPIMGYQYASLDDEPAAVRELQPGAEWTRIEYRFDSGQLVMADQADIRRLAKVE